MPHGRQRITVVAYAGFDPATDEDVLVDHLTNRYGAGWQLDDYDAASRTVSASRPRSPRIVTKPSSYEAVAADLEPVAAAQ